MREDEYGSKSKDPRVTELTARRVLIQRSASRRLLEPPLKVAYTSLQGCIGHFGLVSDLRDKSYARGLV